MHFAEQIRPLLAAIFMAAAIVSSAAENLAGQALIFRNLAEINRGESYPCLLPANAQPRWQSQHPFGAPETVEIWFPQAEPPTLERIEFTTLFDGLLSGDLEIWQDGRWQPFLSLPERPVSRADRKHVIAFPEARVAHGYRLVIGEVANLDHDVLNFAGWNLPGTAAGKDVLFATDDLQITCAAPDNTFDMPAALEVTATLRNSTDQASALDVEVAWCHLAGFPVDAAPATQDVALGPGEERTIPISQTLGEQGPYLCTVRVRDGKSGALLAAERILVGLRDPALLENGAVTPLDEPGGHIVNWQERLREHGTLWSADITQSMINVGRYPGEGAFRRLSTAGAELLMSEIAFHNFEPLPGVYNLALSDYLVTQAEEHGLGLELGLWWWDFRGPSQWWLADERRHARDGEPGAGWDGIHSLSSRRFRRHALRAVEILVKRYRHSAGVWLWHPHPYGGVDHDSHGIYDFHPDTLQAWARYLEAKYGGIAKLNEVYGTTYETWAAVPVPTAFWEPLVEQEQWETLSREVDVRPAWLDWLDFYHTTVYQMRVDMMKQVRAIDTRRSFSGINASGGVGRADDTFAAVAKHGGGYGDQGINILHHVRRLVAKRRYGLPLRHEDITPVTIGRKGFDETNIVDRCNWDVFQACTLGVDHYNYVFTTWDDSAFFEQVFANDRAKRLIKEANRTTLAFRPVGYIHSFETDVLEGKYVYQGISIHRWFTMNGFSAAMVEPGNYFEPFSTGGPLDDLDRVRILVDDGSRVLPRAARDRLVRFVAAGGKLVLLNTSGEYTLDLDSGHVQAERFGLLRALGYTAVDALEERHPEPAVLTFAKDNPVCRQVVNVPLHYWSELSAPADGKAVGAIGDKVGAVWWPHGQGEVLLLAGQFGAITEGSIQKRFTERDRNNKESEEILWRLWANAEREKIGLLMPLMRDLAEWGGVSPQFELAGDFYAVKRTAGDTVLIYLYNRGPVTRPVLRIDLAQQAYAVTAETLNNTNELGVRDAETLATPGVALPELGQDRFMAVRLTPAPDARR